MNEMNSSFSVPPVDVFEGDRGWQVLADLPGVAGEDVQVNFERGVLSLSGHRGATRYARQLRFGPDVDADGMEARFRAGVLQVDLPKLERAKPRQIPVQTA